MKVGLISDTHDRVALVQVAAALFRAEGVRRVLHLGDVTREEALAPLAGFDLTVVQGNNDARTLPSLPMSWMGDLEGLQVAATHGHDKPLLARLIATNAHAVVLHGHTHRARDVQVGATRVVNPGALHRCRVKSIAILDTAPLAVRFHEVREDGTAPWTPPASGPKPR